MPKTNAADRLLNKIDETKNPSVVGLDPFIAQMPEFLKQKHAGNSFENIKNLIIEFNCAIIDAIYDIVPAVKPQIAFYEQYGSQGVIAFEETVKYAKEKGLIIVEDGKRNDIGSTVQAYADGHLGEVVLADGSTKTSFDVDYLTVSPYLGSDGLKPFITVCKNNGKGIFILVKTSNPSSGEYQNKILEGSDTLYAEVAKYVSEAGENVTGERGYSPIGAVVGATYPEEAEKIRKLMPKSIFLVPGYGAQGGGAKDTVPCFNNDGYGAIVNSSRGILYAYNKAPYNQKFSKTEFTQASRQAAIDMREDIVGVLKENGKSAW